MRKLLARLIIATALIITGSACTPQVVYVPQALPMPVRPELPAVTAEDLAPLSKDAADRVQTRDRERRQYCEKLETIIENNNKKAATRGRR